MRGHHVTVLELHAERRVRQGLYDLAFHLQCIFFRHTAFNDSRGREFCINGEGNAISLVTIRKNGWPGCALPGAPRAYAAGKNHAFCRGAQPAGDRVMSEKWLRTFSSKR